jgi:branched-subunit amino acid transport protein AzlD
MRHLRGHDNEYVPYVGQIMGFDSIISMYACYCFCKNASFCTLRNFNSCPLSHLVNSGGTHKRENL